MKAGEEKENGNAPGEVKKFIPQPDLSICLHFQLSTMAVSDYQCLGNMMDGETQRKHLISKMIWDKILFLLPFVTQYGNMPDTSIMTWNWYPVQVHSVIFHGGDPGARIPSAGTDEIKHLPLQGFF
ncbi:unnamed protein product [Caretta caretta]